MPENVVQAVMQRMQQGADTTAPTIAVSRESVTTILNTVYALESGAGPKPATGDAYPDQVARFSGQPVTLVRRTLAAQRDVLAGTGRPQAEPKPVGTPETQPSHTQKKAPGNRRGLVIGLLLATIGIGSIIAANQRQERRT